MRGAGLSFRSTALLASSAASVVVPPVAGYAIWVAPESRIFSDSAGTTPATSSNEIRYWEDLSGNGNHPKFTLGVGQNCNRGPRYSPNTLNSKRIVDFGFAQTYCDPGQGGRTGLLTDGNLTLSSGLTVFWVGSYLAPPVAIENGGCWFGHRNFDILVRNGAGIGGSANGRLSTYNNSSGTSLQPATNYGDSNPKSFAYRFSDTANEQRLFVSGASVASVADGGGTAAAGRFAIGYRQDDALDSHHTGYIAEMIVYTSPLSDADVLTVGTYLATKYGV